MATHKYNKIIPWEQSNSLADANQYNAVVAQNKSLQGELILSKKIIELMAKDFMFYAICPKARTEKDYINNIKNKALQELEA